MSDTNVVTIDDGEVSSTLPERLSSAIGDASSSIGVMMSELVRRSLHSGVADIEQTLAEVTAEKVDLAIELQMPAVSEVAHQVAETTSVRVVKTAVTEVEERSQEALQTAVTDIEDSIKQTSEESREGITQTTKGLAALQSKGMESWNKVKSRLALIDSEFQKTTSLIDGIFTAEREMKSQLDEVAGENLQLKKELAQQTKVVEDLLIRTERDQQAVNEGTQRLQERLEQLEQPRGFKAVWQKLRPGKKSRPTIEDQEDAS